MTVPGVARSSIIFTTMMLVMSLTRGLNFPMRTASRFSTNSKLSATTIAAETILSTAGAAQHPSYDIVDESVITEYGCKAILYRYTTTLKICHHSHLRSLSDT